MKKSKFFASIVLTASLLTWSGCAKNPADGVPAAGVNTPAPVSTSVGETSEVPPTPTAGDSGTPVASTAEGTVLAFAEGTEVKFKGSKVTGAHDGGFRKVSGNVTVPGEDLSQAVIDVTIDMTSTYSDDEKLTGHLMSPDFFDVEKFATSTFKSTSIVAKESGYEVTGDLTLHGVTKSISFPAEISLNGGELTTKAEFAINRKDFEIVYPGKPDDLIRDEVVILFDIKAGGAAS